MESSEETPEEGVNESHPNEGEIEEAVENTDLTDTPEDAADDSTDD